MSIESNSSVPLKEVDRTFKIESYLKDHVYPFADKVINARLSFTDDGLINQIKGWFGDNVTFVKKNNIWIADVRNGENCLYYWLIHYSDGIKVICPESLIDRIKKYGESIVRMYKE